MNLPKLNRARALVRLDDAADVGIDAVDNRIVRMAQVDGEEYFRRHHRGRIGRHLKQADGEQSVGRLHRRVVHRLDHLYGGHQGVAAIRAQRRAGMSGLAGDTHAIAPRALNAGGDAERDARLFQHRGLLDMRLDIGRDGKAAGALRHVTIAGEDRLHCVRDGDAVGVTYRQHPFECFAAGEDVRAGHARCEARALFVGPGHDLDGAERLLAACHHCLNRLERGENPEHAVELAAGRLRVDMRAGNDGRKCRIAALVAQEEIGDAVRERLEPDRASPGDHLRPRRGLGR